MLLNASQGDVPIRRAWASFTVSWWNTDDPDDKHARTYTYSGNSLPVTSTTYNWYGTMRTYDFFSNDQRAFRNIESGVWRVLDTEGSSAGGWPQAPHLATHPLVLNANLGSATGMLDGGPHWVPDNARVTVYVEDANGVVTSQSGSYDHKRSEWRGSECISGSNFPLCTRGFERLAAPPSAPTGTINVEIVDGVHRITGSGQSTDGRIVDRYWEINEIPFEPDEVVGRSHTSREEVLGLAPSRCLEKYVTLILVDDQGRVGSANYAVPSVGDLHQCIGR